MHTAPWFRFESSSVRGVQLVPPLVVFHTPPDAVAIYTVFASVGSTAIPTVRPPAFAFPDQNSLVIGLGPIIVHIPGPSPCCTICPGFHPGTASPRIRQYPGGGGPISSSPSSSRSSPNRIPLEAHPASMASNRTALCLGFIQLHRFEE